MTEKSREVIDNLPEKEKEKFDATYKIYKALEKYVFPPQFDFTRQAGGSKAPAVAMFVFEFAYRLSGKDLSNIWQNVLPPSSDLTFAPGKLPRGYDRSSFVSEASVVHPILHDKFFNYATVDGGKELRWMVFKVKQRAANNYNDILKITRLDKEITEKILENSKLDRTLDPSDLKKVKRMVTATIADDALDQSLDIPGELEGYSYNWPYDYFSFVELANIEAEVTYGEEEQDSQPSLFNAPRNNEE